MICSASGKLLSLLSMSVEHARRRLTAPLIAQLIAMQPLFVRYSSAVPDRQEPMPQPLLLPQGSPVKVPGGSCLGYWGYREYWWPLHAVALASAGSALHAHEPRCAVDSGPAHSIQTATP